jgi:hypothetical protein
MVQWPVELHGDTLRLAQVLEAGGQVGSQQLLFGGFESFEVIAHSEAVRGKVTGTPVGCACGEGVLDCERIIRVVRELWPMDIVFSVECGTTAQAAKSLEHLFRLT